jgi:urease accessory protein
MRFVRPLLVAGLAVMSGSALAHPGHEALSLASGIAHPFGGADHLLAMLAVGLYAARQGGAARWALPLSFVAAMLAAAGLASAGVAFPLVEVGVAASVLILGLMIAALVRLPLALTAPLVGLFALCHGAAHVAEKGDAGLLGYAAGFALASAALHGCGWLIGRQLPQSELGMRMQRVAGGVIAVAGGVLLGA